MQKVKKNSIYTGLDCAILLVDYLGSLTDTTTNRINRTTHNRHQCRKTTVLSCHRCLINIGVNVCSCIMQGANVRTIEASIAAFFSNSNGVNYANVNEALKE